MPLTEHQAKNAKPREQAYKLADARGLFLLVQRNGARLWRMKYRYGGKEKLLSFGACPGVGIYAAREKRTVAKAMLAEGRDPMKNKSKIDPGKSDAFRVIAERWHENRKSALDPANADRVWSRLERDVFPFLGSKLMHEISPPDVWKWCARLRNGAPSTSVAEPNGAWAKYSNSRLLAAWLPQKRRADTQHLRDAGQGTSTNTDGRNYYARNTGSSSALGSRYPDDRFCSRSLQWRR